MKPHRIVSLIPSGTELVTALGFGDELVGRSHECDYPASIAKLPVCSESCIDVSASSREIDNQVRKTVRDALSVYRVFVDELNRLQPTHIVTQSQCKVCAVSLDEVQAAVCELVGSQPEIISLEPLNLADIWSDIVRTAEALGNRERGEQLVTELWARLHDFSPDDSPGDKYFAPGGSRPRVVCLEWLEPMMSAGNWVPELVELVGGDALLCEAGKHSPYFGWEELTEADPDLIAIMPCGFDIARTLSELDVLVENPQWAQLRAVQQQRVYVTDGNQYFNRPGPRVVESAEILREILQHAGSAFFPDVAKYRHYGTGWQWIPL